MNYGIISVRTASTRLPEKCLFKFGDGNVLEHMIRRAKHFGFTPVVATTDLREDDIIEEICCKEDCFFFRGSAEDKLQRWLDTCEFYDIEKFVTLDGDDLFFDPDLAYEGLELLKYGDIVYPPRQYYVGSFSFALTRDTVRRACEIKDSDKTEMQWHFVEKLKDVKRVNFPIFAFVTSPDIILEGDTSKIRLTLDYSEDYWMLDTVRRILGHFAKRREIEALFLCNPDLHKINWFRNEQMKRGHEVGGSGLL